MSKAFVPATILPGVVPQFRPGPPPLHIPIPVLDKKGRQVCKMPRPVAYQNHFKTAGVRAEFLRIRDRIMADVAQGKLTPKQGEKEVKEAFSARTNQVPIYRGLPAEMFRHLKAQMRRQRRKESKLDKFKQAMGLAPA
jgi:hypothetical protein